DGVEELRRLLASGGGRLERDAGRSGYFIARPQSSRYFRTGQLQFRYALVKEEFRHELIPALESRVFAALRRFAAARDGRPVLAGAEWWRSRELCAGGPVGPGGSRTPSSSGQSAPILFVPASER